MSGTGRRSCTRPPWRASSTSTTCRCRPAWTRCWTGSSTRSCPASSTTRPCCSGSTLSASWARSARPRTQVNIAQTLWPVCDLNVMFLAPIRNQTVTLKKGRTDPRKASLTRSDTPPSQKLQRSKSWTQDKENELIRELSKSLGEQAKQVSSSLQWL